MPITDTYFLIVCNFIANVVILFRLSKIIKLLENKKD